MILVSGGPILFHLPDQPVFAIKNGCRHNSGLRPIIQLNNGFKWQDGYIRVRSIDGLPGEFE